MRRWRSVFSSVSIIFMLFRVGTAMAPTVESSPPVGIESRRVFELPQEAKLSPLPNEPCRECANLRVSDELSSSMITTTSTTTTIAPQAAPPALAQVVTVPAPAPAPRPVEEWRSLVSAYFAAADVETALAVISCESGGDPNAINPTSGAGGLFQHIPRYWPERAAAIGLPDASIFDPIANVAAAAWLVYTVGWSPWNASAGCW